MREERNEMVIFGIIPIHLDFSQNFWLGQGMLNSRSNWSSKRCWMMWNCFYGAESHTNLSRVIESPAVTQHIKFLLFIPGKPRQVLHRKRFTDDPEESSWSLFQLDRWGWQIPQSPHGE
jgi:hypothetical protein